MLAMPADVLSLARAVERKRNIGRSAVVAGVKRGFVEGVDNRPLTDELRARGDHSRRGETTMPMPGTQRQNNSARRMSKICRPDLLLFMAIAACILSASGIIPKALSLAAVAFLFACSLVLTGVMLFWLLCPMSFIEVLAILGLREAGTPETHGQSY
jgi:hypothetical protein